MSCEREKAVAQLQYEKKISCLCQQVQEYQKQIDSVQDELERTRNRLSTCCREQEDLKRQLGQKDDAITCYESRIDELQYELKEKERSSQRAIDSLQDKVCKYHEQAQQRESALLVCRNEVKTHLASMEEVKNDFGCELQQRDLCISQMKEDLRRVYEDLKCKSDDNCQLERSVVDLKSRLHQCCCQLKEANTRVSCLQEKLQQIENQNFREKQQCVQESEDYEKKLASCCNELTCCQSETRKIKRCLQEKDETIQGIMCERNNLARELGNEKQETDCLRERVVNLENDNKEICRLLQQKVKCIKELENSLCVKEQELEQCQCCVEELNSKIRELNVGGKAEESDNSDILNQLRLCREKLKKLEAELEETTKKLDWAIQEMERMAKEIKRLNCELDEAKKEIFEKTSMVGDLERTIEHAEQDMENRMRRVDEQLQKYEREIKDKTHMIAECEEKCCRYQHSLSVKSEELDHTEQRLSRAACEIQALSCKTKELEEIRDCLQKKCNEQRAQYSELCQEYKLNREHLQCQTVECNDAKRDLACCQRDLEKHRRETDELRMALQEKENCLFTLTEEKSCLSSKVSSLQCRLENETAQLTQQMADSKYKLEKEIEQLKCCQMEMEEVNANLMQKVSTGQRQLSQLEKCYYQKVDTLNRENSMLQNKLADKEDQLQATKDCITLRDSEIMRLKLRLCSLDRCNSNLSDKTLPQDCCLTGSGCSAMTCLSGVKARKRSQSCGGEGTCCSDWKTVSEKLKKKTDYSEC